LPFASHIRSNISRSAKLPRQFDASLTVDVANDVHEKLLKYQVLVNTTRGSPLDYTTLCFSEQTDHHGLSIFVSQNRSRREAGSNHHLQPTVPYTGDEELSIHIHLTVPRSEPLGSFTTYLPDFTQTIGDVQARNLLVEGARKPIIFQVREKIFLILSMQLPTYHSQSPQTGDMVVRNIMAPIQGYLNVSSSLDLKVIKGCVVSLWPVFSAHASLALSIPTLLCIHQGGSRMGPTLPSTRSTGEPLPT
jgi:hypothetical protein